MIISAFSEGPDCLRLLEGPNYLPVGVTAPAVEIRAAAGMRKLGAYRQGPVATF